MTTFESWTLVVQAATFVAGLVTLGFLVVQVRAMSAQLVAMQEASRTQASLELVKFLQSSEMREARECVRSVLSKKHHDQWDEEERRHASAVCSNYDVLAGLLRSNLSHVDLFTINWGTSILHCHQILSPYINQFRKQAGGDSGYWSNFDWLHGKVASRSTNP